ncbi:hypothetical protein CapIbe_007088 [Capra ibex]
MTFHVVFALNVKQGISQEEKNSHQRILLLGYYFPLWVIIRRNHSLHAESASGEETQAFHYRKSSECQPQKFPVIQGKQAAPPQSWRLTTCREKANSQYPSVGPERLRVNLLGGQVDSGQLSECINDQMADGSLFKTKD